MAASDARQLIGELDRERVTEEDLVSLPVHHCYVRATVDGERMATYSMKVRKPEDGDPAAAERVLAGAAAYTTPSETIASQDAEAQRLVQEFRDKLEEVENDGASEHPAPGSAKPSANGGAGEAAPGKRKRQRRRREGTPEPAEAGDGSE